MCTALPQPTPQSRQRGAEVATLGLIWDFGVGIHLGKLLALSPALPAVLSPGNAFFCFYPVFLQKVFRCGLFQSPLVQSLCLRGAGTISPPLSSPSYLLLFRGDTNLAPSVPFPTES